MSIFLWYNTIGDNMKVLSLKEPFATLIKNNKKYIETRSWKTNYRGEIYIHASQTKIGKSIDGRDELKKLVSNDEMNYGNIICKCQLIDCIEMTEEYINKIKTEAYQQYICGQYEVGRFAWILQNIEPLKAPIPAKGQLGIWNYKNRK